MDSALEYLWEGYRRWLDQFVSHETRRKLVTGTALAGVFIAGFLAWRDEHSKVLEQQAQIKTQEKQLATGPSEEVRRLAEENKKLSDQVSQLLEESTPRTLTGDQQTKLLAGLKSAWQGKDKAIYWISVTLADREAYEYAQQMVEVFMATGWIGNIRPIILSVPTPPGVLVPVRDVMKVPLFAQSVMKALNDAEVKSVQMISDGEADRRENFVSVVIGSKPH